MLECFYVNAVQRVSHTRSEICGSIFFKHAKLTKEPQPGGLDELANFASSELIIQEQPSAVRR